MECNHAPARPHRDAESGGNGFRRRLPIGGGSWLTTADRMRLRVSVPEYNFREQAEEVDPNDPRFSSKWSKANGKGCHGATAPRANRSIHTSRSTSCQSFTPGASPTCGRWSRGCFVNWWRPAVYWQFRWRPGQRQDFPANRDDVCSIVSGMRFAKFEVERTGGVMIVIPEYPEQFRPRMMAAIEARLKPYYAMLGQEMPPLPIKWVEQCEDISTPNGQAQLYNLIEHSKEQIRSEYGVEMVAAFVDTSSAAAPGYDPLDTKQTAKLYAEMQEIRIATNIMLAVIDHFGKDPDKGLIGSSVKEQKLDSVVYCKEALNGKFEFYVKKVRNGPRDYALMFELHEIILPGMVDDKASQCDRLPYIGSTAVSRPA